MQNWSTVAIPFAAGIKPVSGARTLDQRSLLTAQNVLFRLDEGPEKRYGHTERVVRTSASPPGLNGTAPPTAPGLRDTFSLADPGLAETWLHGWGIADTSTPSTDTYAVSPQPQVGNLFGQFTRNNEVVAWDGHRALSYADAQMLRFGESLNTDAARGPAVMPALRAQPLAKASSAQLTPAGVDNGVVRTVAWTSGDSTWSYSVFDSVSGTCLVHEASETNGTPIHSLRAVTAGPWTHIVVLASSTIVDEGGDYAAEVLLRSFHQDTPDNLVSRSLGAATRRVLDVAKYSETLWYVVRVLDDAAEVTVLRQNGTISSVFTPDLDSNIAENVAIAVDKDGLVGLAWQDDSFVVWLRRYSAGGAVASDPYSVHTCTVVGRFTLAPNYLTRHGGTVWRLFIEDTVSSVSQVVVYSVLTRNAVGLGDEVLQETRHRVMLASEAFAVGQRVYVWLTTDLELQSTWFLCDQGLQPVGKMDFGLAAIDTRLVLSGVTFSTAPGHPFKDRIVFAGALGYRLRVSSSATSTTTTPEPNGVFAEPSIRFYELDFLPQIASAQAGQATYIAGAQLWEYDGVELNEAGLHQGPEGAVYTPGSGGSMTTAVEYRYRIDLCYKNAQNEEVRSWSAVSAAVAMSTNNQVTITIPHMPMTRRENAYFLVFRTEGDQTQFHLASSRDPQDAGAVNGYVLNDRADASYTFVDRLSDAALLSREYHPANAANYLQPLPAPACELVAAGRDRLWLAGGELAPGEIAPSRLFHPGETPSFTPALNIQVDRNSDPITAVGFVGETAAFFRRNSTYVLNSDGPSNVLEGAWGPTSLALADVGAINQHSLALGGEGLYFQSPAGFRVLTQGGGLRPPGAGLVGGLGTDVDTLAVLGDYAAAVVVPTESQIRWYSRDPLKPTMVVDYTRNIWTTWTGVDCVGATYWYPGDSVILAKSSGVLWREDSDVYMDGDRAYESVVRSAWLRAADLGDYQRVKRWAVFGAAGTGLSLKYSVFYDERPFSGEIGTVDFPGTDFNDSEWGGSAWGSGPWGDSDNVAGQAGLWFRDGVFKFRRRTDRQKCSVFSIELSDQGGTAMFRPAVLALELGQKPGLDRIGV